MLRFYSLGDAWKMEKKSVYKDIFQRTNGSAIREIGSKII